MLAAEVLEVLRPRPGMRIADVTFGLAGHARLIADRIGPDGLVIGVDRDAETLQRAAAKLSRAGYRVQAEGLPSPSPAGGSAGASGEEDRAGPDPAEPEPPAVARRKRAAAKAGELHLHHAVFAALPAVLAAEGVGGLDGLLADLGVSSPQIDDPKRGFSYMRAGPLDMRMDRSRGRTAGELLATVEPAVLAKGLRELGDEPAAEMIADALCSEARAGRLTLTGHVAGLIVRVTAGMPTRETRGGKPLHPAARTFQALRMMVNRELETLAELLRVAPAVIRPGGRLAVISFHSGEDRLVKRSLDAGVAAGTWSRVGRRPVRAGEEELESNPRARSAKLRWAIRAEG